MTTPPLETKAFPITTLAKVFGCDPRALRKRLDAAGIAMGPGGWTIKQAHQSLVGDGSLEALRASRKGLQDIQRELAENELRRQKEEMVDRLEFEKDSAPFVLDAIRIIEASNLTEQEKHDVRAALSNAFAP